MGVPSLAFPAFHTTVADKMMERYAEICDEVICRTNSGNT